MKIILCAIVFWKTLIRLGDFDLNIHFYDDIVIFAYLQEKLFLYYVTIFLLPDNKSHPASTKPQSSEGDPRLKYAVKKLDPRIHFALVCGAMVRREYKCVYKEKLLY